jgi:CysZ protein
MLDAAVKALSQILSPPMRRILWRSIALALGLIVVVCIGLDWLVTWFMGSGQEWAAGTLGPQFETPLRYLRYFLAVVVTVGIVIGGIFLMPAVTALVASVFVDEIAEEVERKHYPAERPGSALPLARALIEGVKTALLAVLLYVVALPFFFFAIGVVVFFLVTAWLLGREYFLLAAMRFRSVDEAKAFRKQHASTVFASGCVLAAFVSIPIVNLATPLFGTAFMVHMHKRLSGPRPELLEPARTPPAAI